VGTVTVRQRSPAARIVRMECDALPAATSTSGWPSASGGRSSAERAVACAVMKMMRMSAAPSASEGIGTCLVMSASAPLSATACARSSSDSSSVDCICMRTVK
jgi:hypothetical protein